RLIVFPNPSPSRINFKVSETEGPIRNIQVFDGTGRTISDVEFEGISQNSGHFQISKSGLFYVCFQFENGNSVWKKVAVTKI
ncbi:MAG TPA: T9SS type A sorting domain-containing protein, partial [Catalimonadaceae bacterium]|nr:T9SS type A sorting domain-containing protein [Catalimonadaceae bacterium]